jgi:hypothetical protein
MSVLPFGELLSQPQISRVLLEPQPATNDQVLTAVRKCIGAYGEAAKCLGLNGPDNRKCVVRYIQAQACMATVLAPSKFEALQTCVTANQGRAGPCESEMVSMQRTNAAIVNKYATDLKFEGDEDRAWTKCGTPTVGTTQEHVSAILGCSMSTVCPSQVERWASCMNRTANHSSACVLEGQSLLLCFRPYMEKVYIKDPLYLLRGAGDLEAHK